jgi:hypothetical protein
VTVADDDEQLPSLEGFEYEIDHTPWGLAKGNDLVLSLRESDDGRATRRLIRWHSAIKDGIRSISIDLVHQKRRQSDGTWEDANFDLRHMTGGQEVRLEMTSQQTARLREHLNNLQQVNEYLETELGTSYRVYGEGTAPLPTDIAAVVARFLANADSATTLAEVLAAAAPNALDAVAVLHQQKRRQAALAEFEEQLDRADWGELDWQTFFTANDWIFGHGLDYQFLVTEQPQPAYGGTGVTGHGGQRGDYLMASVGDARFSVLVEIKKPDTPLLGERYRNGAWAVSAEVAGGVAQLQTNCSRWEFESRVRPNSDWGRDRGIDTAQPKGILLVGRLRTITTSEARESFERFRRHLWNPEILTYDQLFQRARFIVERTKPQGQRADDSPVDELPDAEPPPPADADAPWREDAEDAEDEDW